MVSQMEQQKESKLGEPHLVKTDQKKIRSYHTDLLLELALHMFSVPMHLQTTK